MYHQVIALSAEKKEASRGPLSLFTSLPTRRLEFRVGKFSMVDFFDVNGVGGDSHLQFMDWAVDQNAGYDFSADPRCYTWCVIVEYQSPAWGARFGEALMPLGDGLEWNLQGEYVELRVRAASRVPQEERRDYSRAGVYQQRQHGNLSIRQ
jgi:hypothetical protein